VDYVTAMNVAYGITGGSGSGAVGAGGANGTPIIQANVAKGAYKAHLFSAALRVNFVDMQRSNLIGRSLDQLLQDGIRLTYDKHMDANVYTGFEDYGTTGLMNSPNVTETTAASNGADSSSTKWKDKTPQQILKDVNDLLSAVWASCEYDTDAIPNHILLPYEQYNYILTTMVSDLASETMLKRITQKLERIVRMMAKLWAQEIMYAETMEDAKALYERCPRLLKEKVKAILIKSGFEEITQ